MRTHQFAERLNAELDKIGLPLEAHERTIALAKLLKLPQFKVHSLLDGSLKPDPELLDLLAEELEVDAEWLMHGE
jgi:hypothetical protein